MKSQHFGQIGGFCLNLPGSNTALLNLSIVETASTSLLNPMLLDSRLLFISAVFALSIDSAISLSPGSSLLKNS